MSDMVLLSKRRPIRKYYFDIFRNYCKLYISPKLATIGIKEGEMREQTGQILGSNDLKLHSKTWFPEGPPKAVLAVVHGAGEHVDRYPHFVEALVPDGFILAGYDQCGHGKSEGQRGHINSWSEYREDCHCFLGQIRDSFPELPFFLYGHSMGSLIVLDYILHYPEGLQGAILSGTALDPMDAAPPFLVQVAKIMSRIIPSFSLKVKLEGSALSRVPETAAAYMNDPLVHWTRSVRWGTESLAIIEEIKARMAEINLPTLILHGEMDPLVAAAGAQELYDQIQHPDKTLKIYAEGLHEPHNDVNYPQTVADIRDWMNEHL